MKLDRKINIIEVKGCFVVGLLMNMQNGKKKHLYMVSRIEFARKLTKVKPQALKMSERQLDKLITDPNRRAAYDASDWRLGRVQINEAEVWTRAGGMPLEWTNRTLKETAMNVKRGLKLQTSLSRTRVRLEVSNMLETNISDLQRERSTFYQLSLKEILVFGEDEDSSIKPKSISTTYACVQSSWP